MPDLADRLFQRFRQIESSRLGHWDSKWQMIADDLLGRREFTDAGDPGRRREKRLYDTTGRTMVNLLAGGLHSLLTNPATEWYALRTVDPDLMENHDVQVWLEHVSRVTMAPFQSPAGRFSSQADECYLDVVSFGTTDLFVSDVPGAPVLFKQIPLVECFIAENDRGVVDTVFRKFKLSARQASQAFGESAPDNVKEALDSGNSEKKFDFLHVVEPSNDPSLRGLAEMPMPFVSVFLSCDTKQVVGSPGGYFENPHIIWRWRVDGGEVYGRGPGDDSLADQRLLHSMNKTGIQAAQMGVAPPFLTEDEGSIVQLDLRPFGRNIVKPGGILNPPIQSMDIKAQQLISIEMLRDKRGQVEEAFHFELLKLIQNRGLTPMTAKQASLIEGAVQRLLAPILGRAHVEWIHPLVERIYGIQLRRGNIPVPPPELSDQPLRVEALSPITRAQRAGDVDAAIRWLGGVVEYAQTDPSVLDLVDADETWRFVARNSSVPPQLLRDPRTVERLRRAQAALAAEQDAADAEEQGARTAKDVGAAVKSFEGLLN